MTAEPTIAPWRTLAATALVASRDQNWETAAKAVNTLADNFSPDVILNVLLRWIDTAAALCGYQSTSGTVRVVWREESSTETTDADSTPPAVVWAGRLFAARVADDYDQFKALINSCRSDDEFSAGCTALLNICGTMLRNAGGGS